MFPFAAMKNLYQQVTLKHHYPTSIQSTLYQLRKSSSLYKLPTHENNEDNFNNYRISTVTESPIKLKFLKSAAIVIKPSKITRLLSALKYYSIRIFSVLLVILTLINRSNASCRGEPPEECESICSSNPYVYSNANCTIRALVLAPNSTFYEASLPKIVPILKIAEDRVKALQLLPPQVKFSWISRDDRCDAGYALIGAMDGIVKNCSHVVFGPACDYPLASVGRVAKYFHSEGTPILSVGGFTYDFQEQKTSCKDEFYMLIRTGIVSFQSISELIVAVMKNYDWNHTLLLYKRDGQMNVAGLHTCQLMMKTLVETYKSLNVTYSPFDLDSGAKTLTEDLQKEIGTRHSIHLFCKADEYA